MSRAGKFIPGGGGGNKARTGPIRAPDPSATPPDPSKPAGEGKPTKKPFVKGSLVKPVAKAQKLPIVIMSAVVCCLLVSVGWYTMAYLPTQRQIAELRQVIAQQQADAKKAADDAAAERLRAVKSQEAARGTLTVDSNPTGATATLGDFTKTTPANFTDIPPGPLTLVIHADGYEDYKQELTVVANQPTQLGTITLAQKTGNLSLTSPQKNVTYKMTGPSGYDHEGQVPDKLEGLPVGDYQITPSQQDWTLPPVNVTIRDHDNAQKELKFPYASVSLTTTPPGATVRDGRTVLGQTPLSIPQLRPRDLHLSVDLPPYTIQRLDLHVTDFATITKQITLPQGKDFINSIGIPMVWIPEGNFWAGKYEVRQSDYQNVTGNNPSTFRFPSHPVESVSWDNAVAFIEQLNNAERKAGKLSEGYHYALPRETQWEILNDEASLDQAATSRVTPMTATQDTGYSSPNKYGLYDTLGNVWEWCADVDENGNHPLRGGCWLSSAEHFPNAGTRNVGAAKYTDQFIGFRVVLVPN
jgi:cell division protein FtsL